MQMATSEAEAAGVGEGEIVPEGRGRWGGRGGGRGANFNTIRKYFKYIWQFVVLFVNIANSFYTI